MRVLFITRKYPPSIGGMQTFAFNLYNSLAKKTDVCLIKWGGRRRYLPVVLPYLILKAAFSLAGGSYDIIHVNDGLQAPFGWLLSRLFRRPYVVVLHGLDITYTFPLYQLIVPFFVRRSDAVFCISQAVVAEAKFRGVKETKIHLVTLAIDDDYHGRSNKAELIKLADLPANAGPILLTVGRLVERKGVRWFIESVLPELIKDKPNLVYLVIGDGEQMSLIEATVSRLNIDKHVRLLGRVDDNFLAAAYNGADLFIMPNVPVKDDIEGFGLVSLEAAMAGLPVVASNLEGIADAIVDEQNGRLVEAMNEKAYLSVINYFLNNAEQARQFGKKARDYTLKHYRWESVADKYVAVYKQLALTKR